MYPSLQLSFVTIPIKIFNDIRIIHFVLHASSASTDSAPNQRDRAVLPRRRSGGKHLHLQGFQAGGQTRLADEQPPGKGNIAKVPQHMVIMLSLTGAKELPAPRQDMAQRNHGSRNLSIVTQVRNSDVVMITQPFLCLKYHPNTTSVHVSHT